jgi:membrane protease YdiL (CAAX protease family)
MPPFQPTVLIFIALWLAAVALRFRRSTPVLLGGLVVFGLATLAALLRGKIGAASIGLAIPHPRWEPLAWALPWLGLMLAASPLADRLASLAFRKPPTLGAFRALQQSPAKLLGGIVVAWALGGLLEELVFRGVVLNGVERLLAGRLPDPAPAVVAILAAAAGAGIIHLYQGARAALIITQLSALFGALFVLSGHSLWAVIVCHGSYDTIAFVRFALKKSKYSDLGEA